MDHGYITVRAIDARRASKLYFARISEVLNREHPEVQQAARMTRAYQIVSDDSPVQVSVTSPLIDFIRNQELPQIHG